MNWWMAFSVLLGGALAFTVQRRLRDADHQSCTGSSDSAQKISRLQEIVSRQSQELRAQREIIERQRRLELTAQTVGEAAHDIQNILAPIDRQITKLLERSADPARAAEQVAVLRSQVRALFELNSQLLALSSRGRREHSPLRLGELLEAGRQWYADSDVSFEVCEEACLVGSWNQVLRMLMNLIQNALDAGIEAKRTKVLVRSGRRTFFQLTRCHLGILTPGDYAYIEVIDRGLGIPKEVLPQIFAPYFSTKKKGMLSGSGLGLSIAASVVQDHDGVLDVLTNSEGTHFTVYFPLYVQSTRGATGAVSGRGLQAQNFALLARFAQNVTEDYALCLRDLGYHVIDAPSFHEVIKAIHAFPVQLMIITGDAQSSEQEMRETLLAAAHIRPNAKILLKLPGVPDEVRRALESMGARSVVGESPSIEKVVKSLI
ncbi:MAG: hypothetical protein J0M12_07380 [Deltaproteobacteria bacterium]|nr:hypothetical protein [Deltaproteobacteria bacterium]